MTGASSTNGDAPPVRVLLVDDHPVVHFGLGSLFESEGWIVVAHQAFDAASAVELWREHAPDLAIVDLALGASSVSGLELVRQLREVDAERPILVLSMHDEAVFAERVLRAGAQGYITKQNAISDLMTAIRRVLSGELYVSDQMSGRLLQRLVGGGASEPQQANPLAKLSDRELEVYERIGLGESTREIAESLGVSPKTIETHRMRIKQKLGVESTTELVRDAVNWVTVDRASSGSEGRSSARRGPVRARAEEP